MNENPERKDFLDGADTSAPNGGSGRPEKSKKLNFIITVALIAVIIIGCAIYGAVTENLAGVMSTVGSIALAILVLLIMITVHELGHYVAGKLLGFGITEFALGFGPAVYKKLRKNGEYFSVRALPIGGFCAFEGEDEDSTSPTAFNNRKPWQRIIVLVAGATMNFLTALVIIAIMFGVYGQSMQTVFEMEPNVEYAQDYSLQEGDVLIELEGKTVYLTTDIISALDGKREGDTVTAVVYRRDENGTFEYGGEKYSAPKEVTITLRADVDAKNSTDTYSVSRALGIAKIYAVQNDGPIFKKNDVIFRARTGDYDAYAKDENGNYLLDKNGEKYVCDRYLAEQRIYDEETLYNYLSGFNAGDEVKLWIFRTDAVTNEADYYPLSFTMPDGLENYKADEVFKFLGATVSSADRWTATNVKLGFFQTLAGVFVYAFKIAGTIFTVLGDLITGALGLDAMGGTVTTVIMTSQAIQIGGLELLLNIAAYIGVNLAVFNLLPLPALDGSRVVFTVIEWIRRKPVNKKVEAIIHTVGLVLLLGFAVLVDVLQLF